jgi:hypothetical protein
VVATPYLSTRVTGESPTLHALAGSPYHDVMKQEFDQVWSEGATLFRAEPRRGVRPAPPVPHAIAPANANANANAAPPVEQPPPQPQPQPQPLPQSSLLRGLAMRHHRN